MSRLLADLGTIEWCRVTDEPLDRDARARLVPAVTTPRPTP